MKRLNNLSNKNKYFIIIITIISLELIALVFLYYINYLDAIGSLLYVKDLWILFFFILYVIVITSIMMLLAFKRLFRQEKVHYTDVSFLFGLFFLSLSVGKALGLLYVLIFFYGSNLTKLNILKIRYFLIILTSAPLVFIGINLIIFTKIKKYDEIKNSKNGIILAVIILLLIICIQSIFVLFTKTIIRLRFILIYFHAPSLLWICITFIYAKKSQKIPQINSLLIGVAFLIDLILYIDSTVIMPIKQTSNEFSITYSVLAELIDLLVIIVIFIGYYNINLKDKSFFKNKGARN